MGANGDAGQLLIGSTPLHGRRTSHVSNFLEPQAGGPPATGVRTPQHRSPGKKQLHVIV
jgi:hypothetical protein